MFASSIAGILKICIVLLGTIILILGLFSHYDSLWVVVGAFGVKPHTLCDRPGVRNCPDISMEIYFVVIIILTFILSIISLAMQYFVFPKTQILKLIDAAYHVIAAILVLIAAIVYLVSASQIKKLVFGPYVREWRTNEKFGAGSLSIFQAILYGATTVFILKQKVHRYPNLSI